VTVKKLQLKVMGDEGKGCLQTDGGGGHDELHGTEDGVVGTVVWTDDVLVVVVA